MIRRFWIRFRSWEYWPVWIVYFVIFFAWLWYALRLRSFLFFTTVNPTISMGGMMGESKIDILKQIPKEYKPKEVFLSEGESFEKVKEKMSLSVINFPCIAKPDVGERGFQVVICHDESSLKKYHQESKFAYIIQEFITFEEEFSVLYYRIPNKERGEVTSLCRKVYLHVIGNGKDTLEELLKIDDRSYLQLDRLKKENKLVFEEIIPKKEKRVISRIGNHSKGTMFLDLNEEIDEQLTQTFDAIFSEIKDVYFGRADLKCTSLSDLKGGKNIRILEINGVSAEPAHIYDPKYSFVKATRDLLQQWKVLFEISKIQLARGVKPMSVGGLYNYFKKYRNKIKEN